MMRSRLNMVMHLMMQRNSYSQCIVNYNGMINKQNGDSDEQ